MEIAVAIHHKAMREAITAGGGYEVKTIGDAFMVAHEDPTALCMIALEAQKLLLAANWPDELFDEDDARIVVDPNAQTHLFRGLRVRMGIHYGPVDVMYDDVAKGYDYYGDTVNCASRVEHCAFGGQILISGAAFDVARPTLEEDGGCIVSSAGVKSLKGIKEPQQLYSLLCSELAPREDCFKEYEATAKKISACGGNDTQVLLEMPTDDMSAGDLQDLIKALRDTIQLERLRNAVIVMEEPPPAPLCKSVVS
jgi:class 3 adenylate cyclase